MGQAVHRLYVRWTAGGVGGSVTQGEDKQIDWYYLGALCLLHLRSSLSRFLFCVGSFSLFYIFFFVPSNLFVAWNKKESTLFWHESLCYGWYNLRFWKIPPQSWRVAGSATVPKLHLRDLYPTLGNRNIWRPTEELCVILFINFHISGLHLRLFSFGS